ncbi:NAD(P)-dependent dehydrogenase (short-subunit alcohol dehydrogenase family) [Neobacillus niacini]|uniref:SDR family oxidoreductase n=1 Tax=Neobacillus niacini TaxID=86668 RepID=UPI0028589C3F|nr:SDR family oxidoreductase [Neobacillus niacini]MDR7076142.1 NAD(P)-dependent dehydrogenase (short-subunit alcohol dehydrogenase family) [Neobacillus niacini]
MEDLLNYKEKTVVVTGASSGMGEATTKLLLEQGANVYALDIKEPTLSVKKYISVDLGNKKSIDNAVEQLPKKIDKIFNVAGIPGTTYGNSKFSSLDVITINFLGPRYLIELLIPRLPEGGAISIVSSIAGMRWMHNIGTLSPLIDSPSFEEGQTYFTEKEKELLEHYNSTPNPVYTLSKEAVLLWVKKVAYRLSGEKIRINTISPAAVITPMTKDFDRIAKFSIAKERTSKVGRAATAEEVGNALLLINSDLSSYISGQDIQVDYAYVPYALYSFA